MIIAKADFKPAEEVAALLGIPSNQVQVSISRKEIRVELVTAKGENVIVIGDVPADKKIAVREWATKVLGS